MASIKTYSLLLLVFCSSAAPFCPLSSSSSSPRRYLGLARLHSSNPGQFPTDLLDEAVLLYYKVGYQELSSNSDLDEELKDLRKSEVISLIEDVVFPKEEPRSVEEILRLLDTAILEGYESTFTPDEFDDWAESIQALHMELNHRTNSLPTESNHVDQLRQRLSDLETLISPTPRTSPRIATGVPPLLGVESADPSSAKGSSSAKPVLSSLDDDFSSDDDFPTSKALEVECDLSSPRSSDERTSTEASKARNTTSDVKDSVESEVHESEAESADIVTSVVSAAAIGAVAVTKAPFFAAGIALSPAIKSVIAYAKDSMNRNGKEMIAKEKKASED